ncbi:MAG: carboxylate-amine ligase [Gemmatimonadetes bacterium]|nr:carboxylate-amine ligase [Gemmatimonadota bacterium]
MDPLPEGAPSLDEEIARFAALQAKLRGVWEGINSSPAWTHTSVVVPSLSFDQEELTKIQGVAFYEERLLFTLMRLRHPGAHVIYVTAQPIHPDIIDYYLHLLVGVPASHARRRLALFCVYDASHKPLSQKILERPRLVRRMREWLGDSSRAYLTCFNSSVWERRLAIELGIPLNGLDPELLGFGTKTGSRRLFRECGVPLPEGIEAVYTREEIVAALDDLACRRPGIAKAVLKLDASFSGEGNAMYRYPENLPAAGPERAKALDAALEHLDWSAEAESPQRYFRKFSEMGGIVEEFLEAAEVRSPSAQARVLPTGECEIISTHEQLLGGKTGQAYLGCRFPADEDYRLRLQEHALSVGRALAERGVVSRFAVDFLATRASADAAWDLHAIEINLRMGGTTHPFMALRFLTGGGLEDGTGTFLSPRGQEKHYLATDGLTSPAYRGLLPEDLMEILSSHGLHFRPSTETGVLFHMIGALSQYGRIGVTSFGNSAEEARELYDWAVEVLDRETGATRGGHMERIFDQVLPTME